LASDDDDDIPIKPKKKSAPLKPKTRRPPARFLLASGIVKMLSLAIGGFITLVGWMSIFGLVLDNGVVRLVLALIPAVGLALLVTDRLLKRFDVEDRRGTALDVLAISLLAQALLFLSLGWMTHGAFVKEGDRYARQGSRLFARAAYLFGGKSPTFDDPDDKTTGAAGSASAGTDAGKGH
jgi:hypothetical protein